MDSMNVLANEIYNRLDKTDLYVLSLVRNNKAITMEELSTETSKHRNTLSKVIQGLYKCCLINIKQISCENNRIYYEITKFGESTLNKKINSGRN